MKHFLLIFTFLLATSTVHAQEWLPQYGDPYWHKAIPASMRQSYVAFAEPYLGKPWSSLPISVFAEYKKTGNRSHYESLMFDKRRQLAAVVLAEVVEGKGRFMTDIINGIQSTLEETWWGLPAHYDYDTPRADCQYVDLFNAETASLMAYIRYMFSGVNNGIPTSLTHRIDSEISRRVLTPAIENNYWWKRAINNWNPWICSNWLVCVLFCEHDEARKAEAIRQINESSLFFLNSYPEDGGCDEGPQYWHRAAASLFEVCYLLHVSKNEAAFSLNNPKLYEMGSYIYKVYAGNGYVTNFSDTHGYRAILNINISYLFGLYTGDKLLCGYSAWMGKKKDILHNSSRTYNESGNWPPLGRELCFLRNILAYLQEEPREPLMNDVWLPNLQIMTARPSSHNSLFVAFKGGNNGESHNHNDVGSFIVYSNGEPLFIDVGVSEYNAKTFSQGRYEIWNIQSDYHNLPRINGFSQHEGAHYQAEVVKQRKGLLTLDISQAYPESTRVDKWYRTISTRSRNQIDITEDFVLSSYEGVTQLMFITPIEPVFLKKGKISLGASCLVYNSSQLTPHVEEISSKLDSAMKRIWGQHLYRIVLDVSSHRLKQRIKYSITLE